MNAASAGASDFAYRISRRRFLEISGKLIAVAALGVGLSGCTDEGKKEDEKPETLAEPGKYMIRKANEAYPISDIPDSEKQIEEFENGLTICPQESLLWQ